MTPPSHERILMVIPSIEGARLLERMLPTLRIRGSNVVVLDQGSRDDTARVCADAGVELMQLDTPRTYTEACNIGARLAEEQGFPFVCLANNDIAFRTDVLGALLEEMDRDPQLAIVAPSQIVVDPVTGVEVPTRRVSWNLQNVTFLHDASEGPLPPRIEADFCELTCALVRRSALAEVGFLDETYAFYHEDADLCFRLRQAGYGAAYLPRAQILHFTSSTFGRRRQDQLEYQRRNRIRFARKYLGYGVNIRSEEPLWQGEAATTARRLASMLHRFGLQDSERPNLDVGRIGAEASGYLLTTQASSTVPSRWSGLIGRYRAVFATSQALTDALREAGFSSFHVPLGVEPDIFNPWGPVPHRREERTCLAFPHPYDPTPFANILDAWTRFMRETDTGRLVMVGTRLATRMGRVADRTYRSGGVEISEYDAERIVLREQAQPLGDEELAALYRSADFTLIAGAEGANLTLLETIACGTPALFDANCPAITALYREAIGLLPLANSADGLLGALRQGMDMAAKDRADLAEAARYCVLNRATLRHSAMALRAALEVIQERDPARLLAHLSPVPEAEASGAVAHLSPTVEAEGPQNHPAASVPSHALRVRLSGTLARRMTRGANLAAQFGTLWQERGLPTAVTRSAARIGAAARRRLPGARSESPAPAPAAPPHPAPTLPQSAVPVIGKRQPTPLLIGYIDAQLGIGQSLRGLAHALDNAGAAFSIYPFGVGVETRRTVPFMPDRYDEATPHNINIIEVSPAELPRVFANVSEEHFRDSTNILRTYWELARGPTAWREGFGMEHIDEIWAPNAFCAEAFRDFFDGPITIVPPCLDILTSSEELSRQGRERFGLVPGVFHFMFSFDYFSFPDRKNPLAVIRAFMGAFPDPALPVALVIKASGADHHHPAIKQEILAAAQADGRIRVIDRSLSREDMIALMAGIDGYVSLHRSEGFGLGMAEALMLEKPVIATGYSGNAEFVTEDTGYPITYTLVPVRPDQYVHAAGQVWADPDEDAAVMAMRAVFGFPATAATRARAGRDFVLARYGARNVGQIATERLSAIAATKTSSA